MILEQVAVNAGGLVLISLIAWFFWFSKRQGATAAQAGGAQEIRIRVKGGYDPDTIRVRRDVPVRLHFTRQESALCSEVVIFDKLGKSAKLPQGETVTIEFTPTEAGEIPFWCQMGMLHGRVIVTE